MSGRRGFTTQEPWLPIVIVVLLSLIAFGAFRRLGSDARIRERLERNLGYLSVSQGDYFAAHRTYTADLASLRARDAAPLTPDSGNIITIVQADSAGFLAVGTNPGLTGHYRTCGIYAGAAAGRNPALKRPNHVSCW